MTVPFNKFNIFVLDLSNGKHNLGSDTLKVALTNTAPVNTNQVLGDLTEISGGTGYTAGGTTATLTSNTQTSGTEKLILQSPVFTATGSMGPLRYAVLYNFTQTSPVKPLIGWWDYGSSITLANTDTFTPTFDGTAGVLTIA